MQLHPSATRQATIGRIDGTMTQIVCDDGRMHQPARHIPQASAGLAADRGATKAQTYCSVSRAWGPRAAGRDRASVFRLREELLADITGAPGRNYVTGALGINVTASNRVYWRSKPFTGTFPVTGSVNLPVILQCTRYTPFRRTTRAPSTCGCSPRVRSGLPPREDRASNLVGPVRDRRGAKLVASRR